MGVKYAKEYSLIIDDLTDALLEVEGAHEVIGMETEEWTALEDGERRACIRTLADDVFYGLGADPIMELGSSTILYDKSNHVIRLAHPDNVVRVVRLI